MKRHPEHESIIKRIDKARKDRNARQRWLRLLSKLQRPDCGAVIATVSIAYFQVSKSAAIRPLRKRKLPKTHKKKKLGKSRRRSRQNRMKPNSGSSRKKRR